MGAMTHRLAVIAAAALAPLAFVTLVSPGTSKATECGDGTVYDADSDTCASVVQCGDLTEYDPDSGTCFGVAPEPPPPPSLPAWDGDWTPGFSISACVPNPFLALCSNL